MPVSFERQHVDFLGKSSWRSCNILRNYAERWTILVIVSICHTSYLPKFGNQMLNCPSIWYIVPAKIFPAFPLCQKNWFCGKVSLNDFCLLLCSIASTCIHIGAKRIYQACCLHHLKNMGKKCKTQLWDKKQNRVLFLGHPTLIFTIKAFWLILYVLTFTKFMEFLNDSYFLAQRYA